ncbi:MAG: transglycosylase SLT domain-containing protein [Labilithrix sp.]|nr:transglycosylase SLT domain-containing protein [Labilithrix sp.]
MSVPVAWVVGLLAALEPKAPWSDTYEKTAEAIARVSESEPLFAADDRGEERTATLLVAIAWYESRLKPSARSKNGRWYCLYQLDKSYLPNAEKALSDPEMCTRAAVKILRKSLAMCKARPPNERLAAFMSGQCDRGGAESRYRMFLANKLLREHPMPPPSGGTSTARAR